MTRLLLLGATGRTGTRILRQLLAYDDNIQVTAALRNSDDTPRLPETKRSFQTTVVDIENMDSLRKATSGVDIIVNAIRIPGETPPTALIKLDKRIRETVGNMRGRLIITVGGAGTFHMYNGKQLWQDPVFPKPPLPRAVAQAKLRDYLEDIPQDSWAYLMPPPVYDPTGPRTGYYHEWDPSYNEGDFLNGRISYEDFAIAVCDAIREQWTGVHFIVGQESGN